MHKFKIILCAKYLVFVLLVLNISLYSFSADQDNLLKGCIDPNLISEALTNLSKADWKNITLKQIRDIWPSEVKPKECIEGGCRSTWSMDRIINGQCYCCALFLFEKQGTKDKPSTEWLKTVIIHYAINDKDNIISIGKMFISSLGIASDNDLKSIGKKPYDYRFLDTSNENEVNNLVLQLYNIDGTWKLYLNNTKY